MLLSLEELPGLIPFRLTNSRDDDQTYPLQYGTVHVLEDMSRHDNVLKRIQNESQQAEAARVIVVGYPGKNPAWRITVNTPKYVVNAKVGVEFIHSLPSSFGMVIIAQDWHYAADCLIQLLKEEHPDWDSERHYGLTVKAKYGEDAGGRYWLFSFIPTEFVWELKNQ